MTSEEVATCPLCGGKTTTRELSEAGWLPEGPLARLVTAHPGWRREDGACPACVQQFLLETLLEKGEDALHEGVQQAWPLDAEAAFGALPTPLRLHAHPRFTGAGITLALVDAAFYPHPDLVRPRNRIRAWVDASREPVRVERFPEDEEPTWPGWDRRESGQWHGLMTSAVAAGSGFLSHGLYRGLAPDSGLVLVQVRDSNGRISNASIARALDWIRWNASDLGVRVVNLSLGGEEVAPGGPNPVDEAVAALVAKGVVVMAAAGNDGERRLVPPGMAPDALTIGGLDDHNTFDHEAYALWRSNYGEAAGGAPKPELVAPSLYVVAPILPGTELGGEAAQLFDRRARGDRTAEPRLSELKLVTPHYQHVEGTSFAAPIVAGVVACMLEANPGLGPSGVRRTLMRAAEQVPGAPPERQGAGAVHAGAAVALALAEQGGAGRLTSPAIGESEVEFFIRDPRARQVSVVGSWDAWKRPGSPASELEPGLWRATAGRSPGRHLYKFLVDDRVWLADPENPVRAHDGHGGWNSVFES
jgi:serine protease AprX